MRVGDILDRKAVERLPAGSIVIHEEGEFYNVVVRHRDGFQWISNDDLGCVWYRRIHADDWTLVHLSGPIVPQVGEVIDDDEQFAALPAGSIVLDEDDDDPRSAPAVKISAEQWMFFEPDEDDPVICYGSELSNHRVIYIPERADTGSGRTAA